MTTLISTLFLEYGEIEIHYNPYLKNKPYLARFFNYHDPSMELRLDQEELAELSQFFTKDSLDNSR